MTGQDKKEKIFMKKKVFSWLLTIASYMFIIFDRLFVSAGVLIYNFFVTGFAVFKNIDIVFLIIYLIVFALSVTCGVFARRLAKDKSAPYYLAFPFNVAYLLLSVGIGIMFIIDKATGTAQK